MPLWSGIFYTLLPEAQRAVRSNLAQVRGGTKNRLVQQLQGYRLFLNYAQTLSDGFGLYFGRALQVESINRQHMLDALRPGKGAIAVTGHLGPWQLAPFLIEHRDLPPFYMAMAEEPNPLVQEFERRHRDRFRIVYTTGSTFSSLELLSVLRDGALLGMQMDRHLGGKAAEVPFCGRKVRFALGPAVLSRLSGAPLVPSFFVFEPEAWSRSRRLVHYLEPAIHVPRTADRERDILDATQRLVAVYERYVRRYASQWYTFHDFFGSSGDNRKEVG